MLGTAGGSGASNNDQHVSAFASEIGKNVYDVGKGIAKKAKEGLLTIKQYREGKSDEPAGSSWNPIMRGGLDSG